MLNLHGATKLCTDTELLETAAKYIYANGLEGEASEHAVSMVSKMVAYDADFIKGFIGRTIRDLQKTK